MSYEKGMEDVLRLVLHEGKKASNTQELAKRVGHLRDLAKQKRFDEIRDLLMRSPNFFSRHSIKKTCRDFLHLF